MGAGMGPLGGNYTQNRASLHLHGGATPWISDGTPHQWFVPAGDSTVYKNGPSFQNVPDMVTGVNCAANPSSACITPVGRGWLGYFLLYQPAERTPDVLPRPCLRHYPPQRLCREAAPFILTDDVEEDLLAGTNFTGGNPANKQILPDLGGVYHYGIPLVIQDKTFVNDATTPPGAGFTGTPTSRP